jgi:hypothetical protein
VYLLSDHRCPFSGHLLAQHWLMWRTHDISETRYWTNHNTSIRQASTQIIIFSDGSKRHSVNATTPILIQTIIKRQTPSALCSIPILHFYTDNKLEHKQTIVSILTY